MADWNGLTIKSRAGVAISWFKLLFIIHLIKINLFLRGPLCLPSKINYIITWNFLTIRI